MRRVNLCDIFSGVVLKTEIKMTSHEQYNQFRQLVQESCELPLALRTPLLSSDTEKRVPAISYIWVAPYESAILLLAFLDEYSSFKGSENLVEQGLWEHQGLQLACSHVPHILWWIGKNYQSESFKKAFSGNEFYKPIVEFSRLLCGLAHFYRDAFPSDRNDTITEDADVIESNGVDSSKRGQRLVNLRAAEWEKYQTMPRMRTDRSQVAEIKQRFGIDLNGRVDWDNIKDDKEWEKVPKDLKIRATFDWQSSEVPMAFSVIKVISAIVVTIASSTGVEYSMEALWAHTDVLKQISDMKYRQYFPRTEAGVQLITLAHFPVEYKDVYWRLVMHPLIVFNVTRSYYVQETRRQLDFDKLDPKLKERRDATAKIEEESFVAEDAVFD